MHREHECLALKSVGILPQCWNRGVAVVFFDEMVKRAIIAKGYKWVDLARTSADNTNTPILAEHTGSRSTNGLVFIS